MNQKEFIKSIVAIAKEREIELSQAIVKELLEVIEIAIDNAILEGKTVKTLGLKFEQVTKEAKSGVTQLGGTTTEWYKPAHKSAKVSYLPSKKKSLEREI